jgi:CRP/FNR family transcriptional regulator, anaerobic regulatory protein
MQAVAAQHMPITVSGALTYGNYFDMRVRNAARRPGINGNLEGGRYAYSVRALQPSSVCVMRLGALALDGERLVDFQRQLIRTMSEKMQQDYRCLAAGTQSAEQRVAAFLLDISARLVRHGLPGATFRLPMSRSDIADCLGLATATVSRVFQRLRAQRLLAVRGRSVALVDLERLRALAGGKARDCRSDPCSALV